MSDREKLSSTSEQLKDSIDDQLQEMKEKAGKYGRIGLWVGGGLLTVYALAKIIGSDDEDDSGKPELSKKEIKKTKKMVKNLRPRSNFLTDSLKEQAILFVLGLAASQLKSFLTEPENKDEQESSK